MTWENRGIRLDEWITRRKVVQWWRRRKYRRRPLHSFEDIAFNANFIDKLFQITPMNVPIMSFGDTEMVRAIENIQHAQARQMIDGTTAKRMMRDVIANVEEP